MQPPETAESTPTAKALPRSPNEFRLSWTGWLGASVVALWAFAALFGPWLAPYHEAAFVADGSFLPAGGDFLLGSDYLGRDLFSRILWGARTTIGIALAATLMAYAAGITLGVAAAVRGGWTDTLLSRANDAILALPGLMLALVVLAALGSSIPVLIGTAAVVYMSGVFRLSRALAQDVMVQDFVEAARVRGEGAWWIIRREVMPNIAAPLLTDFGFRLCFVILLISGLSFLGLGVQPPTPSWGLMIAEGRQFMFFKPSLMVIPGVAIFVLVIAINLLGDGIRDVTGGEGRA